MTTTKPATQTQSHETAICAEPAQPRTLARKESTSTESAEVPTRKRGLRSIRAATKEFCAGTAIWFGIIASEVYGMWDSLFGPLAVQQWGPTSTYTIAKGQTVAVGHSCNVDNLGLFGNQFNLAITDGSSSQFLNVSPGQSFLELISGGGGSGMCNDPMKFIVLSQAANGAVNVGVQASQSWWIQDAIGFASTMALIFTVVIGLAWYYDHHKNR